MLRLLRAYLAPFSPSDEDQMRLHDRDFGESFFCLSVVAPPNIVVGRHTAPVMWYPQALDELDGDDDVSSDTMSITSEPEITESHGAVVATENSILRGQSRDDGV